MSNTEFPFTVAANPGTDLWRKPPATDDQNAPTRSLAVAPLLQFQSASITFSTAYVAKFDQAGLIFSITHPSAPKRKWIKAGVEFYSGEPRISVVSCDRWADWSIAPLPGDVKQKVVSGEQSVTIQVERDDVTLWVYYVDEQGNKLPLREIAWVFGDDDGQGWELDIGALVARPNTEVQGQLKAQFQAFTVAWK